MTVGRFSRASLLPLVLLLGTGTASYCALSTDSSTGELRIIVGTVHSSSDRDGCWRVDGDDGRRYALSAERAPASVLQDGARVRLLVEPSEDGAGSCDSGLPVDVRRVESVERVE